MNTAFTRAHRVFLLFPLERPCERAKEVPSPGSCQSHVRCLVAAILILNATSLLASPLKPSDGATITAIWRIQALPFEYRSHTTYYDCDALKHRVRAMLELMGARPPISVRTNCGRAPAKQIHIQVVFATPVPATEENVRAATAFDSKDELVARVHGSSLPTAADIERFPAQWQTRHVRITQSDCDLMRDIHEQIVPKLSVQSKAKKVNCPRIASLRTNMQYEALIAVPDRGGSRAPQS